MAALRAVRFLFGLGRGKEGLGVGDADVMMMAGAFIGWQPILVSFFVGVFAALIFGVAQLLRRGDHPLAFGPALAAGVLITVLEWPAIGRWCYGLFAESWILPSLAAAGAVILLAASFLLRLLRGVEPPEDARKPAAAAKKE
jgi:leader peptidase (prepilin peptidase)/N-methyltransferase